MGRQKVIYEVRDLEKVTSDMLKGIDKALLAAAFKIRDNMRNEFLHGKSLYKHSTSEYSKLANGIMVGKLKDGQVKIHALGNKEDYNSYKTRFFVGGTRYRKQTQKAGESIKPYTKGFIKSNEAVDKGISGGQQILNNFIGNVLNN